MFYSRKTKLVTSIVCVSLSIASIPINIVEKVFADDTVPSYDDGAIVEVSYRSVEDKDYVVDISTTSVWTGHSNLEFTFTNTGTDTIHNWYFTFDFEYNIENPYNCYTVEHTGDLYTIGNNDWNQDILPGESVTVGFTVSSDDGRDITNMPTFYLLNTKTINIPSSDLSYSFEEYSDWTAGFSGALILTNNSQEQIRDWTVTFDSNRPITQVDAAALTSNTDGTYSITNDGITQNVFAGQTYRIELQGGEHDSSIPLELTNYTVVAKSLALSLDDDTNDNGVPDVLEMNYSGIITVTPTDVPTVTTSPTATDIPTPTVTVTPTATDIPVPTTTVTSTPSATPTDTVTPTPIITTTPTDTSTPTPTATPTAFPDDLDYDTDSDSDGVPDDLEDYYGTDKNDPDTDDDGVNDLYELMLFADPLVSDSNGNNDSDLDGLSNALESELGTNPLVTDSDLDGLSDGEEYNLYGTDPTKYDSDDDDISDYNEIYLGSNPVVPDSDILRFQTLEFVPASDSDFSGVTKVIVSGNITGSINENTKIRDVYGTDPHTSSIEALVGDPINIESTGDFDSMTITFEYSDGLNEDNLRIMWYDEENYEYVVLNEYTINKSNNTISVITDHFSKYMLIDEEVWVNTWINAIYEVGYTSNMFTGGYLRSPNSYSQYMINKYGDNDSDGIADALETDGMIDNIGHVIYTNKDLTDSDEDYLSDGYEMGDISSLSGIFARSPYEQYRDYWPVSAGARWEDYCCFKSKSNATLSDSDFDGASDGEDATLNDVNDIINYILFDGNDENLTRVVKAYEVYFEKHEMKYQSLELYSYVTFVHFFENLEYGFEPSELDETGVKIFKALDKKHYSRVDNIIFELHGSKGALIPASFQWIYAEKISELLVNCSDIEIDNIEFLSCSSCYYDNDTKSVAIETLKATHAKTVYGSTGTVRYFFGFFQVWGGTFDRYYYNDHNRIEKVGGFLGFNVMDRYTCESTYVFEIENYPE